jgi:hypothetical protein
MKKKVVKLILIIIRLYQHTLSADHGWWRVIMPYGRCRYYPSCSEYTRQAVIKFGATKGMFLGCKRIIRCHPYASGGYDPVPEN